MKHYKKTLHPKRLLKYKITLFILIFLVIFLILLSLNMGAIKIAPWQLIKTLLGYGSNQEKLVLFEFRLPRMIIALLVGASLAVSGAVLQAIVKNPLADPGIIGINSGAGLGVLFFVLFLPHLSGLNIIKIPFLAFFSALLVAILIYFLAYKKGEGSSPIRIILTGVAIAAGINALMIVLTLKLSPQEYHFITTWLAGNIWGTNWTFVLALLPWLCVFFPIIYFKTNILNMFSLSDESIIGLGMKIEKERKILLFAAVAIASAAVSVSGGIGFIGLIAPHISRRFIGEKYEFILPVSALIGALLLLLADTMSRTMFQSSGLPAGIIVAIMGAPYFLYLLAKLDD